DRRLRIAQETLDIYAPIANRLGMSKVKNELEELAFKFLEPDAYESLRQRVDRKRRATEPLTEELRRQIIAKLDDAQVPIVSVDGRVKRLYSIHLKLKRQKIDLDQVYDFVALRVVTKTIKDCYAALGIIHQTWSPVPGRIKDFIAMPRANGYQSLHTSVISEHGFPFEVQIRTEDMHHRAEEGIASHWKYKEGRVGAQRDEPYFQWLRQLLEVQQEVRDPQEFLQNLKIDLYPEEVYIFTPKGEVKTLPRGATPIDFAYTVHTDVGNTCVGARVNGKMVPLRTPLKHGDIVEIVTAAKHKPSRDWLNFAKTSRARNKIRHYLQSEEKARSIEIGRKLLEKELRRFDLNVKSVFEDDTLGKIASEFALGKSDDLLAAIGYGKVAPRQVIDRMVPADQLHEKVESRVTAAVKRAFGAGSGDRITVRGFDDMLVFRAKCCNPIRGERIVGYITRGKGVSVHSVNCPNVTSLLFDPERRIDVEWEQGGDPGRYTVRLAIEVENRKGVLAEISSKIADINTNITNVEANVPAEEQQGRIDMTVEISDLKHLEKVIKSLRGVTGVIAVERAVRS
ncbi:MAG: RelA/SpoT family protein, partial [Bacteroidales bacterium]